MRDVRRLTPDDVDREPLTPEELLAMKRLVTLEVNTDLAQVRVMSLALRMLLQASPDSSHQDAVTLVDKLEQIATRNLSAMLAVAEKQIRP